MTEFQCQNCGYTDDESVFPRALNIAQRHEIGDTFTNLECPECSSLAHPLSVKMISVGPAGIAAFKADPNNAYYLAVEAFEVALKHIQDTFGVSGDLAAQYWSGRDYQPVLELTTYVRAELQARKATGAAA